jgi:hypothetical protein
LNETGEAQAMQTLLLQHLLEEAANPAILCGGVKEPLAIEPTQDAAIEKARKLEPDAAIHVERVRNIEGEAAMNAKCWLKMKWNISARAGTSA